MIDLQCNKSEDCVFFQIRMKRKEEAIEIIVATFTPTHLLSAVKMQA